MENTTASIASQVFGYIIAHPGATAREIRKGANIPGHIKFTPQLSSFVERGALISIAGETPRKTKYSKGAAPVKLNQARGTTQKKIQAKVVAAKTRQELIRDMQLLVSQLEAMDN